MTTFIAIWVFTGACIGVVINYLLIKAEHTKDRELAALSHRFKTSGSTRVTLLIICIFVGVPILIVTGAKAITANLRGGK